MKARIAGIGAYAPERVVTNDQLSEIVDTSDEWIRSRTGISERRISTGETTRDLAAEAARRALKAAGVDARELDIIILGTSSPDNNYPSDACSVQAMIGAENAVAFDISAACAGFIFAMNIVHGFFQAGIYKTALDGPGNLRAVWRRSRGGSPKGRGNGSRGYAHGFRRDEGTDPFLHLQDPGKFPYGDQAGAGAHDHGRSGGIPVRSEKGTREH